MCKKVVILTKFRENDLAWIKNAADMQDETEVEFVVAPEAEVDTALQQKLLEDAWICIGEPSWESIHESKSLKLVQMTWAGTDIYTRAERAFPAGVALCNASGAYGLGMSQYALGAVLSLYRNFPAYQKNMLQHEWRELEIEKSVVDATVLIYGSGNIGGCCAALFDAMGAARIIGVRRRQEVPEHFDEVCRFEDAEKYLPAADIVICCMPNTDENQGYLNAQRLALMKKDAVLVNMGRGPFVDDMALADALNAGHLHGAALDVTSPEPLPADHPLWDCERLILTPHVAGPNFGNPQTEHLIAEICAENIRRMLAGEPLKNQVC